MTSFRGIFAASFLATAALSLLFLVSGGRGSAFEQAPIPSNPVSESQQNSRTVELSPKASKREIVVSEPTLDPAPPRSEADNASSDQQRIEFLLVDIFGGPVADAFLRCEIVDEDGVLLSMPTMDRSQDTQGRLGVRFIPPSQPARLKLFAQSSSYGFASHCESLFPEIIDPTTRLLMLAGDTVRGRVIDAFGHGVDGASISLRAGTPLGSMTFHTMTDAAGNFELLEPQDIPATISASKLGYEEAVLLEEEEPALIRLEKRAEIFLQVVDAANGGTVSGAQVSIHPWDSEMSNPSWQFALDNKKPIDFVPAGNWRVTVKAENFSDAEPFPLRVESEQGIGPIFVRLRPVPDAMRHR